MSRHVTLSPDAVFADVRGESIVLQLEDGQYYGLDWVATAMLQELIDGGDDVGQVAARLAERFDATEATIRGDLDGLVDQLEDARIVIVHRGS